MTKRIVIGLLAVALVGLCALTVSNFSKQPAESPELVAYHEAIAALEEANQNVPTKDWALGVNAGRNDTDGPGPYVGAPEENGTVVFNEIAPVEVRLPTGKQPLPLEIAGDEPQGKWDGPADMQSESSEDGSEPTRAPQASELVGDVQENEWARPDDTSDEPWPTAEVEDGGENNE